MTNPYLQESSTSSMFMNTRSSVLIVIDTTRQPTDLQDGISKLISYAPHGNLVDENAMNEEMSEFRWHVDFIYDAGLVEGEYVCKSNYINYAEVLPGDRFEIQVTYHRKIDAFRAIGRLLAAARNSYPIMQGEHARLVNFREKAQFDTQGVMIDCSRNGVLRLQNIYFLLNNMALMGLNMLQLYTEDTYEVDGEPLFGYLRGRYTMRELSLVDDYAFDLGIEVIPCIQTLGHMGQVLQWQQYAHLRDNFEVLLPESEPTYEFIEKLIVSAARPFRSKRIHIGMDEAHGVGEGRYRHLYGYKDPNLVFMEHLQKVHEICTRNDLQPMIWSDNDPLKTYYSTFYYKVIFCLAAKNNSLQGYYDELNNPASSELLEKIPSNLDLVFWDYYHTNPNTYAQKIRQHRDMGCLKPWIATGIWTWTRFWAAVPFSLKAIRASMIAAKNKEDGVQNTFITTWGDDGNECDIFSALPALLYYAQHGYCEDTEVDIELLKLGFEGICGADFDDWIFASKIDDTPEGISVTPNTNYMPNMSKWLLWEDPMLGFLSPQYADEDLESHYALIERQLSKAIELKKLSAPLNERLELPRRIAKALSLKCSLRKYCVNAYKRKDHTLLLELAHGRLMLLRQEVDGLWKYHRKMWMTTYKPFGWEMLESRYGALRSRLETMFDRIIEHTEYVRTIKMNGTFGQEEEDEDERARIPEFETTLECLYSGAKTNLLLDYPRAAFPSRLG